MKATFTFLHTNEPAEDDLPASTYWQIDLTISDGVVRQDLNFGEYKSIDEAVKAIEVWSEQRGFMPPSVNVEAVTASRPYADDGSEAAEMIEAIRRRQLKRAVAALRDAGGREAK